MAANSPLLKPLAIIAGGLGSFQAIAWGILSLVGILVYTEDIEAVPSVITSKQFQWFLVHMYFDPNNLLKFDETLNIMSPGTVVVWTSIYFATSLIWLVISGVLLYDSCTSKFTSKIIIGWVTVSAVVALIDIAGTIAFGVDYDRVKSRIGRLPSPVANETDLLLAPMLMMMLCARGFILWIMNVGLVIYLGSHQSLCITLLPRRRRRRQ